jgi:membrane protein required for colicin V production
LRADRLRVAQAGLSRHISFDRHCLSSNVPARQIGALIRSAMSTLDMVLIGVIVFCGLLGIYWGFIRQVLSVVGLVAGLVLASRYGGRVADGLSSFLTNDTVAQALGFLLVLIAVSALVSLLATLLRRFVGLLFLGWLDHLIGGVLGLVQGTLLCTVILLVAAVFPTDLFANALETSRVAPQLVRVVGSLVLVFLPAPFHLAIQRLLGGL